MTDMVLRVAEVWRYPVKSMGGEQIADADVGLMGIPFDRGWAVRDEKAGAIRSARYIPRLLMCSARYLSGTNAGLVPHVEITLPDGSTVCSDDTLVNRKLSDALGRDLTLWSLKPPNEIEHLRLGPNALITGDANSEWRMQFGLQDDEPMPDFSAMSPTLLRELAELASPRGTYFDAFPFNIITTSSIRHLQEHLPGVDLDVRRFRPNLLIDDVGAGHAVIERQWLGRTIRVGAAEFNVVMEAPRCTMIAAEQPGGIVRNSTITRTIVREMKQSISAYCEVRQAGMIRIGDTLTALEN